MKAAQLQKEFENKMALEEEALRKEELMLKVEERKQKNAGKSQESKMNAELVQITATQDKDREALEAAKMKELMEFRKR